MIFRSLLLAGSLAVTMVAAQQSPAVPATLAASVNQQLSIAEHEVVAAAEAMPESKYSFAPSNGTFKGVRNFAAQVRHIAGTNYWLSGMITGKNVSGDEGDSKLVTKAQLVQYLKDSFAAAHRAVDTLNDSNAYQAVPGAFGGHMNRLSLAVMMCAHPFDHYGQIVEYLRMNDIIPPASR
ncbi:MAG: DinB family protein [Terriglobales bacterium]